jgi:GntR family transcriptional regulator
MIELDRESSVPVGEQLVEQLKFRLATGHFRPGEALPSTRELGTSLGISFHTVRKAYQALEQEGLLEGRRGSGYSVSARAAAPLEDRLERGAAVVHETIQRLIGLGLSEEEVEYVFQEQLAFFDPGEVRHKVVFAALYQELAEAGAELISSALQARAVAATVDGLHQHRDADLVVVPHAVYNAARTALPQAEVVGVLLHPPADVVAEVSRLLPSQTLGLVTAHGDSVAPILYELRQQAGFTGPALALPADAERERMSDLVRQVDLLVYTTTARRRLRPVLGDIRSVAYSPVIERGSLDAVLAVSRR